LKIIAVLCDQFPQSFILSSAFAASLSELLKALKPLAWLQVAPAIMPM
jgi:hypothetical protein